MAVIRAAEFRFAGAAVEARSAAGTRLVFCTSGAPSLGPDGIRTGEFLPGQHVPWREHGLGA